ncbi:MAG: two-component system, cell cycle sensor histidine kinase and response regulator CckA [Gaiellaceae bacterium]|jgi:PAS domain S-box-containing protein|nr:two-component system, cell cycle sensor histidine kinase and response regulator CckA [Gaiellaceae bacterium]
MPIADGMLSLGSTQAHGVLVSPPEGDFDRLVKLAIRVVGASAGLISLLDDEGELNALCRDVIAARGPLLVEDAGAHPALGTHKTIRELGFRGFAGIPLIDGEGLPLGALCVVDVDPRAWTDDESELLTEVAAAVVTRLGLRSAVVLACEAAAEREAVLDSSLDCIIVMDHDGMVREWNPACEHTFGWTREEVIGCRLGDLIVPEELRERHEQGLARAAETGESRIMGQRLRLPALRKDGSMFTAELAITKLERDGKTFFTGTLRDLTEIVRAEEERTAAEARYRSLIENIPLVTYMNSVEEPFTSLYMSPQVESLLGYTPEEWAADPRLARDGVHPDDRERVRALAHDARAGGVPTRIEFRFVARDGRVVWVLDQTMPMRNEEDTIVSHQGFLLDITEQKHLEEQLRQSQKMEAVGQLAGGIAHDFNNMLTAITGYAELLADSFEEGDPRADDVDQVRKAAAHAAALTRQLLAFSRKQVLLPQRLDVNDVLRGLESMLARTLGAEVELTTAFADTLARVETDPDQLAQVVLNFVLNGRDAMPAGGRLTITTNAVELDGEAFVSIEVTDTGTGMNEETRNRAFEPFFTTKDIGKGTGLGLATAYGFVSQSGGTIEIESALGLGSTFRVLLPAA